MKLITNINLSSNFLYILFFSIILSVSIVPFILSLMPERTYLISMIILRTILVFSALIIPVVIAIRKLKNKDVSPKRTGILMCIVLVSILCIAWLSEALILSSKLLHIEQQRIMWWYKFVASSVDHSGEYNVSVEQLKALTEEGNKIGKEFENKPYLFWIMPVVRICTSGSPFMKNDAVLESKNDKYVDICSELEDEELT